MNYGVERPDADQCRAESDVVFGATRSYDNVKTARLRRQVELG